MPRKNQTDLDRDKLKAKAFELLRSGKSQTEAAKICGVSTRTVQRWISDSEEKIKQQGNLVAVVAEKLTTTDRVVERLFSQEFFLKLDELMPTCLEKMEQILNDADSRKSDKIRVCQILGDWAGLSGGLSGSIVRVSAAGYIVSEPDT